MAKYRMVNTYFWEDSYIETLDPTEKLVFLYLLTNPQTNIAGVYEISIRRIAFETQIESDTIKRILDRFEEAGKVTYRDGWVCIHNFLNHQSLNPNGEKCVRETLNSSPAWVSERLSKAFKGFGRLTKGFERDGVKEKEKEKKKEKEKESKAADAADVSEVFVYWQEKLNHGRKTLTDDRRKIIQSRLHSFTAADLKKAIDGAAKDDFLCGRNDRGRRYTDFSTIFRNDSKVENLIEYADASNVAQGVPKIPEPDWSDLHR